MTIKYRELKRRYELDGSEKTIKHLSEALQEGHLKPENFSVRDLAEALIPDGHEWVRQLDPRNGGTSMMESGEGVDVTAFQNVTGQIIQAKILEAYEQEAFVASKLVDTISTRMDGEKISSAAWDSTGLNPIGPGMPYPSLGVSEDYIETPETVKHGFIVPITKEALFFDRTHLILSRASEVGEVLGLNKEKRILDMVLGVTNSYKWKGTSYSTYDSGTNWKNILTSNELVDWTNVDAAEQLFADNLDPNTGEPVLLNGTTVLVMPAYRHAAHRVFNASEITYNSSGGANSSIAANPMKGYQVHESRLAYRRILEDGESTENGKKYWYIGDFRKAFAYMENWPITVSQASANSDADFNNDIVVRFKASERGAAAVLNPRYIVKCTG